jgi:GTP-binding protein
LEVWEELPPIFITSAEKGIGEQELITYIEEINRDIANQSN